MDLSLTKAEEKAMKILWNMKKGLIRDVVNEYEDPQPAYTTVATIIKILEKKGFVGRKPIANTFEYFPLIDEEDYTHEVMKSFVGKFFSNSYKRLVSSFSSQGDLSTEDMEDLIRHFQEEIKNKKQ